ncbi:MAG TPA: hypothetical protein VFM29_06235, partial [Vicinamibacteria bacterium]|nr:hypothetical protein [Vicinamibacteria bacterium]
MTFRKFGLLLLMLLFGGSVETAYRVRNAVGFGPWDWHVLTGDRFDGPNHQFEASSVHPVAAGSRIEIKNRFGAIKVSAGAPGELKAHLRKVVYRRTEAEARAIADRIALQVQQSGSVLTVTTNRGELEATHELRRIGFQTNLELVVPPASVVTVQNEHGTVDVIDVAQADLWNSYDDVRVERVAGALVVDARHASVSVQGVGGTANVSTRHGNVQLRDVAGAATLVVEHGDLSLVNVGKVEAVVRHGDLEAERLTSDLEVRGEHYGVKATDVAGRAVVETTYRDVRVERVGGDARLVAHHGEVRASDVKGAVFAESRFEDVVLARVGGPVEVRVSHGGVQAERLEKGALIRASGEDVVLDGVKGALDIEADRGGIRVIPSAPLTDAVQLRAKHGSVELDVPAGSRCSIQARSSHGELQVDLPGFTITESGERRVAGTLGGGGSLVILSAES